MAEANPIFVLKPSAYSSFWLASSSTLLRMTIMLVEHTDCNVVMENGEFPADGTPTEVLALPKTLRGLALGSLVSITGKGVVRVPDSVAKIVARKR